MSDPMRFSLKHHGQLSCVEHCQEGEYVLHSDYARLKAEVERLTKELSNISGWGRGLESDLSHARVEISFLKAEVGRLRLIAYDEKQHNANLRAEVERLTDENVTLRMERMQDETGKRITYADYASLKAEVERLKEGNDCLGQMHDKEMERSAYLLEEFNRTTAWGRGLESDLSHARVEISFLKAEVERLRSSSFVTAVPVEQYERVVKAGDLLCFHYISLARKRWPDDPLPSSVTDWNAAKEGKPSK